MIEYLSREDVIRIIESFTGKPTYGSHNFVGIDGVTLVYVTVVSVPWIEANVQDEWNIRPL